MGLFKRSAPPAPAGGERTLADVAAGSTVVVSGLAAEDPMRSDRLASLGVVVGCELVLLQRRPAFVVEVGETTLALDRDIARAIRVRAADRAAG